MKLKFKHQKFQADAAQAVCDVFSGQPYYTPTYLVDKGIYKDAQRYIDEQEELVGFNNHKIMPQLTDDIILSNINAIQRQSQIEPSKNLHGRYNLTIEMETGVGKTYTYIKTMYELNKRYGWSKFIVVVPSVAIREGVHKSFQITEDHFAEEYGKKPRYFIYNSRNPKLIDDFARENAIYVMIINSQAFNARGKDARRISIEQEAFNYRKPMDVIAKTNPIVIIDEPQSVEGPATKEGLKKFNPLFTLRYSATHKSDSVYNMIYRLDAMEAYNKKLVKKIAVKGITADSSATSGYIYLAGINLSKNQNPTATLEFDRKGSSSIKKTVRTVNEGYNLFVHSDGLEEYKDGYTVARIDGSENSVTFINRIKIYAGDVVGHVNENHLRRIQIRETILSHLEREKQLYSQGIKVLSLFFIDEVAKYRKYDETDNPINGEYADIFEEEYKSILTGEQLEFNNEAYYKYLNNISVDKTHQGYFSIDKQKHFVDSKANKKEGGISDDVDAYELIMKKKELLLDFNNPVRFIFSHSALREGWDNPNVFQICTLKDSSADIRKRQEVGRGLRLSVNQDGERMDDNLLGSDVHNINMLTVVANESYEKFSAALQTEMAEAVADRPQKVTPALFEGKPFTTNSGEKHFINNETAIEIYDELVVNSYVKKGELTDKYYDDKKSGQIALSTEVANYQDAIISVLDSVYNYKAIQPENARANNIDLKINHDMESKKEFKELWNRINIKTAYAVDFNTAELITKCTNAINTDLNVAALKVTVTTGEMGQIESKAQLQTGEAFVKNTARTEQIKEASGISIRYDLVGKLVDETGLTRHTMVHILKGIDKYKFDQFKNNPEEFILKTANLINEQKATVIVQYIEYKALEERYDTKIYTEPNLKGQLNKNAIEVKKHLYEHLIYDSTGEKAFAENLECHNEVAVYVKLPHGFDISTPMGKYSPDWAIAFTEGSVKHIYFVAETKGSMSSLQLREIEKAKIDCAKKHFTAISGGQYMFDVVDSYKALLTKVMQ